MEERRYDRAMKILLPTTSAGSAWGKALERDNPEMGWAELETALTRRETEGAVIYPSEEDILRAFSFCPPEEIKVLILGQDPYHGPGQAHGLSFSVPAGQKTPPSLRNVFKEVSSSCGAAPQSGDLSEWARQGVLLLNAMLTVEQASPGSHQGWGWEKITDKAIHIVSERSEACVFLLWGAHAIKKAGLINEGKHLILQSPHPSPLSAHRGFLGNRHFTLANEFLASKSLAPIEWSVSA